MTAVIVLSDVSGCELLHDLCHVRRVRNEIDFFIRDLIWAFPMPATTLLQTANVEIILAQALTFTTTPPPFFAGLPSTCRVCFGSGGIIFYFFSISAVQHCFYQDAQDGVHHAGVHPVPLRHAARLEHRQVRAGGYVRGPRRGLQAG